MCNISYGCHGIQDKHKWCSSMSHFILNSTTYTCHCYFLLLAMASISNVPRDKHKLNLIHLSQTNPTIHQKKQDFSKNSVMYLTHFWKKFLNTTYERQLWCHGYFFKKYGKLEKMLPDNRAWILGASPSITWEDILHALRGQT